MDEEDIEEIIEEKVQEGIKKEREKIRKDIKQEIKSGETEKQGDNRISRRDFLKKLGAGALGLGALSLPSVSAFDVKGDSFEVFTGTGENNLTKYLSISQGGPVNIQNTNLDLNNSRITGVNDPENPSDAATQNWVNNTVFSGNYNNLTNVPSSFNPENHGNSSHTTDYLPKSGYNPENDTHDKYTDGEARSAVSGSTLTGLTLSGGWGDHLELERSGSTGSVEVGQNGDVYIGVGSTPNSGERIRVGENTFKYSGNEVATRDWVNDNAVTSVNGQKGEVSVSSPISRVDPYGDGTDGEITVTSNISQSSSFINSSSYIVGTGNTVNVNTNVLVIAATNYIEINGTVDATGMGADGGGRSRGGSISGSTGDIGGNAPGGGISLNEEQISIFTNHLWSGAWSRVFDLSIIGGAGASGGSGGRAEFGADPTGGSGGDGGGIIILIAPEIRGSGSVIAEGVDGGDGGGGAGTIYDGADGGNGGGGGCIIYASEELSNSPNYSVSGGAGGSGQSGETNGSDGSPGSDGIFAENKLS